MYVLFPSIKLIAYVPIWYNLTCVCRAVGDTLRTWKIWGVICRPCWKLGRLRDRVSGHILLLHQQEPEWLWKLLLPRTIAICEWGCCLVVSTLNVDNMPTFPALMSDACQAQTRGMWYAVEGMGHALTMQAQGPVQRWLNISLNEMARVPMTV